MLMSRQRSVVSHYSSPTSSSLCEDSGTDKNCFRMNKVSSHFIMKQSAVQSSEACDPVKSAIV